MDPARARSLNVPLFTSDLSLEPLLAAHADHLFVPLQDPTVYRWIGEPPPRSLDAVRDWWGLCEARLSPDRSEAWLAWAVRRLEDGAYIGKLDAAVDNHDVGLNVGYIFFPPFWGRGHATQAVGVLTEHLLRMGVSPLRALVTRGNGASARVLEKSGYVHTRVLPDHEHIDGVSYDDLEYVRER